MKTTVTKLITIAAIITLAGCAGYPVAIRIEGEHAVYGYSDKGFTIDLSTK